MVKDYQEQIEPQGPAHDASRPQPARGRGSAFRLALLALAAVALMTATGFLLGQWLKPPEVDAGSPSTDPANPDAAAHAPKLFVGWPEPDLVLMLSGQMHGYILPCGCSRPQMGGLERRYNLLQTLKARGWNVVSVDLGDIAQRHGPQSLPNVQGMLKYKYSMEALKEMDYTAIAVGEYETCLPLFNALGEYALNHSTPRVLAANLANKDTLFPGEVYTYAVSNPRAGLKVGVIGLVGPTVARQVRDRDVQFTATKTALGEGLKELGGDKGGKPNVHVLLYQGSIKEAVACAEAFPQFQVVLCLAEEDEPSFSPKKVGDTLVISVGLKGKYVGVVSLNRSTVPNRPFDMRYQPVALGEEYLTPKGKEASQPILKLLEEYTRELRDGKYLLKYGQSNHPIQVDHPGATYVGSDKCVKCHKEAYKTWKDTPHHHAYETLVAKAKNPSLRQYDGECVVCHVVGFGYQGGFTDEKRTPHLENVGCESCHGPASLHVASPNDTALQDALNPWKLLKGETEEKRVGRMDQFCQKCHDIDNDVHWKGFAPKWALIAHGKD